MSARGSHSTATKVLFAVAATITFGAVVLGSVVCATDSSAACPNWPGCYEGQLTPEPLPNPVLEFVHRVVAVSTGPLLLATAIVGLRAKDRLVRVLPWVALAGAIIAGVLGMLTVTVGISTAAAAFDLGASLVSLIAITVACVCVWRSPRRWDWTPLAGLAWPTLTVLGVFHVVGILVAGEGSLTRCMSWPVWRLVDADGSAAGQWVRLGIGAVAVALVLATAALALRRRGVRVVGLIVGTMALLELALGILVVGDGADMAVKAVYAALAGAIFCGIGWIAALASVRRG